MGTPPTVNTPKRLSGFLANAAHETGGFKWIIELASGDAYENRKDLGNLYKGDGRKFKGRGIFQVTGRTNYGIMGKALGLDLLNKPELLATPQYAVKSAAIFWKNIKGNGLMDLPEDWRSKTKRYSPFEYLCWRVNGGMNGYEERLKYFNKGLEVLNAEKATV